MIFVDSSGFVSLVSHGDEFYKDAVMWWRLNEKKVNLLISNLVVMETLGWVRHHLGKKRAVELGDYILSGEGVGIERVTRSDETKAWDLFVKVDGRGVSMVDCTSVILMKRLGVERIFSFDQDFSDLGFQVVP
ncbi:MAG: hypothetical protein A2784_00835 [Candidatus Chisholmbacteria bacterium RIFCSPHIGHO2_01_FULL_48_12]|uniref:Ribonuclease VapC n=1 Tax=Candidatus Chisholmbacteria bacterium RIFCSPHIGHO2_01_FULL_48_12 TaxID=1797589 RepID=A0A1G1VQN1_9BACT|nr:MAG: hypothetical protein A2784_00835 [Candidatus Chisholmbacteria bacterium RIFCSPHIGHO2_01_FULL_48_12]